MKYLGVFIGQTFIILLIAKVFKIYFKTDDISWFLVFIPLWLPMVLFGILLIINQIQKKIKSKKLKNND